MPGEAGDAERESSLLSILQVDVPGLDLHFQVEFKLRLKRSESTHVIEAVEDIVQAFIAELGESAEEPNRLRGVETFDHFKQRALNGVESWRQKLQQVDQWQSKVDKASAQLTKMREGYLKELTFLKEQLHAKAKAERSGVEFIPSANVQLFNVEGAFTPLDDPVDKARREFQAQLAEEREQARARIQCLNEQLRTAKMTISRKEKLIGRFMEKEEEPDGEEGPNPQNGEVAAAGGEPPAPDADADTPKCERLLFCKHLEQKFGSSADTAAEFSARYCNPEGLKFKDFAAMVEAVEYRCDDVQELFAALQRPGCVVLADLFALEAQDQSAGPHDHHQLLRDAVIEPRRPESSPEGKRAKHHSHPSAKRVAKPDAHQPALAATCCASVQTVMDSAVLTQVLRACEGQLAEDAWRSLLGDGGGEATTPAARKGGSAGGGGGGAARRRPNPRRGSFGRASDVEGAAQRQREDLLLLGDGCEDAVEGSPTGFRRCISAPTSDDLQLMRLFNRRETDDREAAASQGAAAGENGDLVRLPAIDSLPTFPRRNSAPDLQLQGSEEATPLATALPEPPASPRQHRVRGAGVNRLTRCRLAEAPPPPAGQWAEDGPGCEARLRHIEELASELEMRLPETRSHIEWLTARILAKTVSRREQLLQERLTQLAAQGRPPKVAGVDVAPARRSYQSTGPLMEGPLVDSSVSGILARHGVHLPSAAEAREKEVPNPPASRPTTMLRPQHRRSSFHKMGTSTSVSSASTAMGPTATPRPRVTPQADDGMQGEDSDLLAAVFQGERAKTVAPPSHQVDKVQFIAAMQKKRMDPLMFTNPEGHMTSTSLTTGGMAVATLDSLASDSGAEDFGVRLRDAQHAVCTQKGDFARSISLPGSRLAVLSGRTVRPRQDPPSVPYPAPVAAPASARGSQASRA